MRSDKQQHGLLQGRKKFLKNWYDRVFTEKVEQVRVINAVAQPSIDDIMEGYNTTILACGQTSSRKTFTMQGGDTNHREHEGIMPKAPMELFCRIQNGDAHVELDMNVTCIENYSKQVFDPLDSTHPQKNMRRRQDIQRRVFVEGMAKICVRSAEEFLERVRKANQNRSAATRAESTLQRRKLFLMDLDGSETFRKSGKRGKQLEKAKKISISLSELGMVISNLGSSNARHIPYRDSKLTRILEDSPGGNVRTTLIINASSSILDSVETLSTLRFGQRAKKLKNQAVVNEPKHAEDLSDIVRKLQLQLQMEKYRVIALEHELGKRKTAQEETNSKLAEMERLFLQIQFACNQHGKEIEALILQLKRKDRFVQQLEMSKMQLKSNYTKKVVHFKAALEEKKMEYSNLETEHARHMVARETADIGDKSAI